MAVLQWTEKMSVGVEALDDDHKKLLGMVNDLSDAVRGEGSPQTIQRILRELVSYVDYHFEAEERLMRLARYENFEAHRATHNRLRVQAQEMAQRYQAQPTRQNGLKILDFLSDWLMRHILRDDMAYRDSLARRVGHRGPGQRIQASGAS